MGFRWSSFRSSRRALLRCVAPALLFVACGGRSRSELDAEGDARGGGTAGSDAGGATRGGSVAMGGAPAGGGVAGSGASSLPDFDFTTAPDQATAYMVDAAHSGAALGTRIEPPLERLWVVQFEEAISYPLVADGRVFVSANTPRGAMVHALDAATGEELWRSGRIEGNPSISAVHLACDRGLVVAADQRGHVVGFEAATGDERWDVRIDSIDSHGSMPVAIGGTVFIMGSNIGNSALFVLDQRDGKLLFEIQSDAGGPPTFGDERIFSGGNCQDAVGIDARSGELLWHHEVPCFSGDGERTLFHDGLVVVPALSAPPLLVLDGASGELVSTIEVDFSNWPANVVNGLVLLQGRVGEGKGLRVFDIGTGIERWSIELEESFIRALVTPGYVYLLSTANASSDAFLSVVNLETHELTWRATEPSLEYDEDLAPSGLEPTQAPAAGGGIIVIPWQRSLAAFRSAR